MAERHHYVAQFHLRAFIDPESLGTHDPWLWVGECKGGVVKRRSPKNFGWARGIYAGPGCRSDRNSSLETFLAREIEAPAARALQLLTSGGIGHGSIPLDLMRYLAWAAARSLPMKSLYQSWVDQIKYEVDFVSVENPPAFLSKAKEVCRPHTLEHKEHGRREFPPEEIEERLSGGWNLILSSQDFLEFVHIQAKYFEERFFPRLKWVILQAPENCAFVLGDRPVVWGFRGFTDASPSALRDERCQLFAPISSSFALFAHHASASCPSVITPSDVNSVIASAAHEWIAGSSMEIVSNEIRRRSLQ